MLLGDKILDLRKKNGLSQEELGEIVDVTRQTISNWELGVTQPNPEQLKLLSKTLKTSIDELLDNDMEEITNSKMSNTEKLAGIAVSGVEKISKTAKKAKKLSKYLIIGLVIILLIDIISFIIFFLTK